jgi:hypothetical protein
MGLLDDDYADPTGNAAFGFTMPGRTPGPTPGRPRKTFWEAFPETTIGGLLSDAWNAAKLPGDVYSGRTPLRAPNPETGNVEVTPEVIKRSADLGGLAGGSTFAMTPATAGEAVLGAGPVRRGPRPPARPPGLLDDAAENPRAVAGNNMPPPDPPPVPAVSPYDLPAGSDPRYMGAAPDRSDYSLMRFDPPRGTAPRTMDSLAALRENRNGIKDQMLADIRRGEGLDGSSWYNTEELRDWFVRELGPERGNAEWKEYMGLIGATSTGSKVPANIGNASFYRNKGADWARENAEALKSGELVPPKGSGYGHKMQGNHAANVANYYDGGWDPATADMRQNPKPRGFTQSLLGSGKNIAADLHFTRYMAMASGSPEWLDTSAEISGALATRLREKYGDQIEPFLKSRVKDGKEMIQLQPKNAVTRGGIDMADLADEPTVFVGKPNDNEYKAFEDYMHEIGKELGMTGPQVQANLWMGAAQRTGLADESQGTFMDLFRKRADERARKEKIQPMTGPDGREISPREQIIKRFINERGLLAVPGAAVGGYGLLGGPEDDDRGM